MITLRAFTTPAEAALAKSLLDDHDIVCSLADENAYLYGGAPLAMPVRLLVAEDQAEKAARILKHPPDGLIAGPVANHEEIAVVSAPSADQKAAERKNIPWEFLLIALLVSVPGLVLLMQKHDLILFASTRRLVRGDFTVISPTNAHWLGAGVIGAAVFLVFLFLYVRRAIATDEKTRAAR